MPQMTTAAMTMHFDTGHEQGFIDRGFDGSFNRSIKARPTSTTIELSFGCKQRQIAASTDKGALAMLLIQRASARSFGAMLAQHPKLLWGQNFAPFRFCFGYFKASLHWLRICTRHCFACPPKPVR